jgi:S-adenosylmethionine:tRNA ribosyltransferase-isomerase
MMKVTDFDFHLPAELIAQSPLEDRDTSRLLCLGRKSGQIRHAVFQDLPHLLEAGDTLVLNNTRVLPARLFGIKKETGAHIEVLLLKQTGEDTWEALAKPAKKVKEGTTLTFGEGKLTAVCTGYTEAGGRIFRFTYEGIFQEVLAELGEMPLPPYIKERLDDPERYQTVYAEQPGSAAAPTAGLHFTQTVLDELTERGIQIVYVTLHVGLGTFRPVQAEHVQEHRMHAEYYVISSDTASALNEARSSGKRIIAVGTTSARTLETIMRDRGRFEQCQGWTDIFIYPGFTFRAIDGLLTNFHLPQSTLVMLVSAFAGKENVMYAYEQAVQERYRFFSFGDAMLIV